LGQPDKIYFVYTENHLNSKNIQKMPEYLLPFDVIIPGVRNKTWKIKKHPEFGC